MSILGWGILGHGLLGLFDNSVLSESINTAIVDSRRGARNPKIRGEFYDVL